jgi:hypothetical protein
VKLLSLTEELPHRAQVLANKKGRLSSFPSWRTSSLHSGYCWLKREVTLLPLMEDFLIELRYLLIKTEVKLLPLMEDFLITLRYLLIKKRS